MTNAGQQSLTPRRVAADEEPRPSARSSFRGRSIALVVWAALLVSACQPDVPISGTPATGSPLCGFWLAIGRSPTPAEVNSRGRRSRIVVLNAWDTDTMRLLRTINPRAKILVYKDLSSTRSYPGAVDRGRDASLLPTGVGYVEAKSIHPEWFARNPQGELIEWSNAYPEHWQMAVWDRSYQDSWVQRVVREVLRDGWDGVLADNDFAKLGYYSNELLAGTSTSEQTNKRIRDGLDVLVPAAGRRLNEVGKILIPNISEARLFPGRWTAHSRFGGAMEEYFGLRDPSGRIIPMDSPEWDEMLRQSEENALWLLLVTHASDTDELRTGFAAASLLAHDRTCWMSASTTGYRVSEWRLWQDAPLGDPKGPAVREDNGLWQREFAGGWVAVNPTVSSNSITPPSGIHIPGDVPGRDIELPPGRSVMLLKTPSS